ncbi:allatotropins-like [Centruroides vittatus]|uniref:allatotropins-like n=1 Tax=Centruroides vittatus TaxID=120091 RepID=UPI00350F7F9E
MKNSVMVAVTIICFVCIAESKSVTEEEKRGFRNTALSTARGFGKRMYREPVQFLTDFGLDNADSNSVITASWLAEQITRNPALAKFIVDKAVDLNGDGYISEEELYHVL